MRLKLWLLFLLALALNVPSRSAFAQNNVVPVKIVVISEGTNEVATRYRKALENSIQLSGRFTLWTGEPIDLPKQGVLIELHSIEVGLKNGDVLGSAVVIISRTPSALDRGYYKALTEQLWMFPKDDSVSDNALDFLADMSQKLPR